MKKLTILIALFFLFPSPVFAIEEMTDENIKKAIEYGKNAKDIPFGPHADKERIRFSNYDMWRLKKLGKDLTVNNVGNIRPRVAQSVKISTPFAQISLKSYEKARKFQTYSFEEAKSHHGSNIFTIMFDRYTNSFDFLHGYHCVIKQIKEDGEEVIIQPFGSGSSDFGRTTGFWPKDPAYSFSFWSLFHINKVNQDLKTFVILIPPIGEKEEYKFDLKKIR